MRALAWTAGGLAWFAVVFFVTWRVTFPSDAVVEWVRWKVEQSGDYAVDMDRLAPMWVGARAQGLALYANGGDDEHVLLLDADALGARTSTLGVLRLAGLLSGEVPIRAWGELSDGALSIDGRVNRSFEGVEDLRAVDLQGDRLPLTVIPLPSGGRLDGLGDLDLGLELDNPEGLSKANGSGFVRGDDLGIQQLSLPGTMIDGMIQDVYIEALELAFNIVDGRLRLTEGRLVSDVVTLDIEGDIDLEDDIARSRLRLNVVLSLGDELSMLENFLSDARWSDGRFHYNLSGTPQRPRFAPERERRARPARQQQEGGRDRPVPDARAEAVDREERVREARERRERAREGREERTTRSREDIERAREERRARREQAIAERRERLMRRLDDDGREPPARPRGRDLPRSMREVRERVREDDDYVEDEEFYEEEEYFEEDEYYEDDFYE